MSDFYYDRASDEVTDFTDEELGAFIRKHLEQAVRTSPNGVLWSDLYDKLVDLRSQELDEDAQERMCP